MPTKTILLSYLLGLISCQSENKLHTVEEVNIERYEGKWYEIARLPNRFEKDLICVTATYTQREDGKIEVLNQGHKLNNHAVVKKIKGVAWIPNLKKQGQLKVRFFWPFAGDYWIISLDKNYQYALVGDPSRKYLWILARTKVLSDDVFNELLLKAEQSGFKTQYIVRVEQSFEN
jgi:lipocalin